MRIIKEQFLKAAAKAHPRAKQALADWTRIVRAAKWKSPVDMHQSISDVDPVKVKSGHTVYVFNIRRNEFRLVCAVHFNRNRTFTLRFMTHAEYALGKWKDDL